MRVTSFDKRCEPTIKTIGDNPHVSKHLIPSGLPILLQTKYYQKTSLSAGRVQIPSQVSGIISYFSLDFPFA